MGDVLPAETRTFTDEGLGDAETWFYRVDATNENGTSHSNIDFATTFQEPGPVLMLPPLYNNGMVTLDWIVPVNTGGTPVTAYQIYRSNGSADTFQGIGQTDALTTHFTDGEVERQQTYWYAVAATNAVGEGKTSIALPVTVPAVPGTGSLPHDEGAVCTILSCENQEPPGDSDPLPGPDEVGDDGASHAPAGGMATTRSPSAFKIAAGAAAAGLILVYPLSSLYHRVVGKRLMEHKLRKRLAEELTRVPGATAADLAKATSLHYSSVRYHLDLMQEGGEVEGLRLHGRLRWFPNHREFGMTAKALLSARQVPAQRRILAALEQEPGLSVTGIARRIGVAPNTASRHLKRLCVLELVTGWRDAQSVRYRLSSKMADHGLPSATPTPVSSALATTGPSPTSTA